jgi:hypothetical protein
LIGMQPNQMIPFSAIVPTIAPIAMLGNGFVDLSPSGSNFSTDSWAICANEITIMTEKTRIPNGSSRLLPTGNFFFSFVNLHCTSRLVDQIIKVQRRSRTESTKEAIRESELEYAAAMHFAISRTTLAMTLIWY